MKLQRQGGANRANQLWRPDHPDRRLQSMNDWYGLGVLTALTGERSPAGSYNWYCGKTAAESCFRAGYRYGRQMEETCTSQP